MIFILKNIPLFQNIHKISRFAKLKSVLFLLFLREFLIYTLSMYHFIVNLHGASGKAFLKWNKIKELLKQKNVTYKLHVLQRAGHATQIAREISQSEENDIKIVVIGGDGTINEVLNGITSFERIKLGVIPTGSGNDFSRGINVPRHNQEKALDLILNSNGGKKIDLGCVESEGKRRIFAISSGFGMDAIVGTGINTSKIKKVMNFMHLNKLSYAILTIITLFKMKTYRAKISFDGEDLLTFEKLIFMAVMNFKAEGGGVPMAPDASGEDALLSVCIASGIPKWKTFLKFPLLCMGKHSKSKGFFLRNCRSLDLFSESPSISHTDGEYFGNLTKIHYECLPSKLTVLI